MGRKYKGTFGYLKKRRVRSLLRSVLELAAVLAIYFTAWAILKDNKNVFTILAALLCSPLDGAAVGGIGTLLYQLLRYGVTATTPLWILPYILCGLLVGWIGLYQLGR